MAQGEGFKHITVTAADEDDVVIVAGVVQQDDSEPEEPAGAPEDSPVEPVGAPEDSPVEPVGAQTSAPAPAGRTSQGPETHQRESSARNDDYRETTLEDLEGKPMPFAQKVTIIAAIVLIVVAIAYYFVAMA